MFFETTRVWRGWVGADCFFVGVCVLKLPECGGVTGLFMLLPLARVGTDPVDRSLLGLGLFGRI